MAGMRRQRDRECYLPQYSPEYHSGKGGGKRDKQSLHFTRQPDQQNLNPSPLPPPISLSVPSSSPFSIPFSVPSSSPLPAISTSSSSLFSRGTIQLPTAKVWLNYYTSKFNHYILLGTFISSSQHQSLQCRHSTHCHNLYFIIIWIC